LEVIQCSIDDNAVVEPAASQWCIQPRHRAPIFQSRRPSVINEEESFLRVRPDAAGI
jgi:hypothetical protein